MDSVKSIKISVNYNGIGLKAINADKIFTAPKGLHLNNAYNGNEIGITLCRYIIIDTTAQ